MTSVDELFKKPLPAGSSKRKFEPVQDPSTPPPNPPHTSLRQLANKTLKMSYTKRPSWTPMAT
ncbi:Beta-catenin-like protein 1 [Penicillium subrubescens]|uniref:Beta-catenin-like protein 1 n=1 Tax=Penicillium subrubescens TaxID=1316194 RepID=UPI002545480C|nr:Beta-catenin-like protein 1 [Penicillium subrubescens]KAJ5890527.1 Beta-catenin-like protein 1 [Penicillium subrubescens]